MADWDPELYNRFRQYRAAPVLEILGRLELSPDERIVDLGCGTGENTIELARRTASGHALGIDSSPAMIDRASRLRDNLDEALRERLEFRIEDIATLNAEAEYTLVFSNAALQWLPDHRKIFGAIFIALKPSGRMVVQVPANENETAKMELSRLAREPRWAAELGGLDESFRIGPPPERYEELMKELGFVEIDCYYRTFAHPMNNPAEVVEFYKSTALRPFLDVLSPISQSEFLAELRERFERAYRTAGPLTFNFRRLFIWGARPRS